MKNTLRDNEIIEEVMREIMRRYPSQRNRTVAAFDRDRGQFVLLREGWDKYQRTHYAWMHIERLDGKFWIHRDDTEHGVANDLLDAGIPKERIVLAYQPPVRRKRGEFAVA